MDFVRFRRISKPKIIWLLKYLSRKCYNNKVVCDIVVVTLSEYSIIFVTLLLFKCQIYEQVKS